MSINQNLRAIYDSKWPGLTAVMQPIVEGAEPEELPASPLLLKIHNEKAYEDADIKLMIFGQETNSWYESFHEDADAVIGYYDVFFRDANLNKIDFPVYGGQFWNGLRRFVSMLQERYPSKKIYFVWNNLVKIGKDSGIGFPSDIIHEVERQEFNVIPDEINVLRPSIALFFTGPNYDSILNEVFNNPALEPVTGDFSVRQLASITLPNVGQAFRTYHPGYLWRNDIDHYFQAIIDNIILV